METGRESVNRILRSRAFMVLVVLLVLVAIISVAMGRPGADDGEELRAKATASGTFFRAGEEVHFSAEGSRGDIHAYYWEFGDGYGMNGSEVAHAFETGGWYNVTLFVESEKGKVVNDTVAVGIQPEDMHNTRDLGRQRDVRPFWMHGYGLLGDVGPNVGDPTSTLEYDVVRAVGTFYVYVEIWVYDGDRYESEEVHRETFTMTGGDIRFSYTVGPEDLPPEAATNYTRVHVSTMIDQGRWASSEIRVDVEFPFEGLVEEPAE
jgi:hypothetical protein